MRNKGDRSTIIIFLVLVCLLGFSSVFAQPRDGALPTLGGTATAEGQAEVKKWREDLEFLAKEMPKRHKNLFHTISEERFQSLISDLDAQIPTLTKNQVAMELAKLFASIGDAHTTMWTVFDNEAGFHRLPIELFVFEEGVFVQAADARYRSLVGAQVLEIGNTPIAEAIRKFTPYISTDGPNQFRTKNWVTYYLVSPEALQALGITDRIEKTRLKIKKDGRIFDVELELDVDLDRSKIEWINARSLVKTPAPLWLRNQEKTFWFEYVSGKRLLYVQINNIRDSEDQKLEDFFEGVSFVAKKEDPDKLVIDIRSNGGGNSGLFVPVIRGLIKLDDLDKRGRLFVIIGRKTFSAAQNFVNDLEKYTNAIFVGEPTGSSANHFGDAFGFKLPNSKLTARVSTLYWQDKDPRDTSRWTAPDVAAEPSFADYSRNIDPALRAILNYRPQKSMEETFVEAEKSGSVTELQKTLESYKDDPVHKFLNIEGKLNRAGYILLFYGKQDLAIEYFRVNTELFPTSSNAFDSLAEGHMIKGNTELAIKYYKKSLELNPENRNAERRIKSLLQK